MELWANEDVKQSKVAYIPQGVTGRLERLLEEGGSV